MSDKWQLAEIDRDKVREFSRALGIKPVVAQLLLARGVKSLKDAEAFLNPDLTSLPNPFLLGDMDKCVARVRKAISLAENILIFGDRDVDGITSVSILSRTIKTLGAKNVFWYIPSTEGYGLNIPAVEKFKKEHDITLLITVDCGISNRDEIETIRAMGIDVIVTDHHEPPDKLPECAAVVNPKLAGSAYPFRDLAGCAVAFKVAHALLFSYNPFYDEELVAVDIETTGLHPRYSEICEIGAALTKNGAIVSTFQTLVKTRKPIPPDVSAIHGITDEMCSSAPSLKEALSKLADFIGERRLLIHNAPFDLSFLRHAFKIELAHSLTNDCIDTLRMSRLHFPFKSHALAALVSDMKIDINEHHRALADAMACAQVFWRLQEMSDARIKYFLEDHLDLVSVGTLADIMPLTGENRTLVKRGLEILSNTKKAGVKEILEGALRERNTLSLTSKYVTWNITPLLNAAGRMGKADVACRLLMAAKADEARDLYDELVKLNIDRKKLQEINVEKFFAKLKTQCDTEKDHILVVAADDAEHGVTGIVASNIVRSLKKPAILFVVKDGIAQGAGRSSGGFNLLAAVEQISGILIKYGGHKSAVGLSLKVENVDEFRRRINEIARSSPPAAEEAAIQADVCLTPKDITPDFLRQIEQLEPFGMENPAPVFWVKGLQVQTASPMGAGGEHLRLKFVKNGSGLSAVGWGLGDMSDEISKWGFVEVVGQIESNFWQEREYPQLQIMDIKET
ncbi:MAG: single-stranded-DNA-specific exonuclease RecJ [Endomicrobiia bacterium]|nr:single-stranded-DNA-specific exonuclease RecJ [Endomicrobiia bacterium]